MIHRIKGVIDANVIISSLIIGGIPSTALFLALRIGSIYRPPEITVVTGTVKFHKFSRDKADNVYIAVALETKAQFLITGDKDLLTLKKQFETLHTVNPREFVKLITNSKIKR